VIALTDTETLIINRDCFESVLKANPGVAERLSRVLERIHAENLAKMQARGVADPKDKPTSALSILKLVKNFFGIPG
jgi:CRP-like cAMP-binding protein